MILELGQIVGHAAGVQELLDWGKLEVRSGVFYMSNKGRDRQEADRTGLALFLFVYLFVNLFVLHIKGTRFQTWILMLVLSPLNLNKMLPIYASVSTSL